MIHTLFFKYIYIYIYLCMFFSLSLYLSLSLSLSLTLPIHRYLEVRVCHSPPRFSDQAVLPPGSSVGPIQVAMIFHLQLNHRLQRLPPGRNAAGVPPPAEEKDMICTWRGMSKLCSQIPSDA